MIGFIFRWAVDVLTLVIVLYVMPGISVDKWQTAAIAALALGLVNVFLRPLIILITLPLNIISLGLFTLVINGAMFYLVSKLVNGFAITSFWNAFWGALVFSVISSILNLMINPKGKIGFTFTSFRGKTNNKSDSKIIDSEGHTIKED